ncbi:MFS transporter [Streptomyces sp. ISL-98]|uniref:MFS transporter n=1 Tax=Streptomyces sp. ISL-98 TaxID=2819192 RepID=UPI001BEA84A2|nr:MFS transporter [Streptomyces sp. ISL-98]MBT2508412.1 MFS transporter [Streptomyces sp. ISL-98]
MYLSASRAADTTAGVRRTRPRPPRGTRTRRAVAGNVIALGAVSLVTDVSAEMVTAVLPLYLVVGLGMSPLAFGALDGLYQGASALSRLAGGHVADRAQRRKLVAGAGYAVSAACKLALLAATTPWAVGAVLAADRTGKGLRTAPRDALISLSCPPEEQGRAFGVHRAMDTAGALLGPLAAFAVLWAARDGYDAVFVVSFCAAALGVLLLVLFVREPSAITGRGKGADKNGDKVADKKRHRPGALRSLARTSGLPRLCLIAALLGVVTVSDSFLYLLLQRRLDLPAPYFPLLPVGAAAGFLLLAVPLGHLADRIGRRQVFLAGHGALLIAYVLLLAPWGGGAVVAGGVLVLLGAFYAATDGVLMAAAGPLLPTDLRASGLALVQTAQALARFAGSLLFGAGWMYFGPEDALTVGVAGLAVALAAVTVLSALRPHRDLHLHRRSPS